ncbi:MAG: CRISPR-associated helicase Cas3' [Dehalococcoidia bacterium]
MNRSDSRATAVPIEAFWAKLPRREDASQGFHPLICHMIDVAAVAELMWDEVLSQAARKRLAATLGLEESAARGWITFLAGLHDTGKCSPAFALRPGAAHLAHLYTDCRPNPGDGEPAKAPHGQVTALELRPILIQHFGVEARLAGVLATAVGGHHGIFPTDQQIGFLKDQPDAVGEGCWQAERVAHVERLAELLGINGVPAPTRIDHAAALVLAGLVSVADWIGSMEEFFPYLVTDPADLPSVGEVYLGLARERAEQAMRELRWTGWKPEQGRPPFQKMFDGRRPRPMQQTAIELADRQTGPGLVVIEAPMGEGKTEAALYLADRWGLEPGARGLYLALPTQATSNQMFGRLKKFLAHRYPTRVVNLQLLHGQADLRADFEELKERDARIPHLTADDENAEQAGVIAATWFTQRKRGLLAPFGVGTVDQALLAVLRTKHVFVRLYGLANRVVVIDEVHAYDTYMTTLIERLLGWLAALGSPVVLLSATLPLARRDALIQAYTRGLTGEETAPNVPYQAYPRMTWVLSKGAAVPEVDAANVGVSQPNHPLWLRWMDGRLPPEGEDFQLGAELQRTLKNGGCAAVICNTVRRAQRVYRALEPYFKGVASDGLPKLDLFHARFLQKDRAEREERALSRFGPDNPNRPDCTVLVATQVIEQSLDLDFDLMVTDFAPADLMLQRSGRLWRHDRARPIGLTRPDLWIGIPDLDEDGLPSFPGGDALIYDEHVLFRSWLTVRGRESVRLPDDIEPLVESAYGSDDPPEHLSAAELRRWQETFAAMNEHRQKDEDEAKRRLLPGPHYAVKLYKFTEEARAEDEPSFHREHQALTRLTEPSVMLVFLFGDGDRPALSPNGRRIDLNRRPSNELTRDLLGRSVTLQSPRGLVHRLLEDGFTPGGWQRSPHLRNARLIVLDGDGRAEHGGYQIKLDDKLGVLAEKIDTPEREQA